MKVIIADDEPLARERLRSLLEGEPGVEVVAEAADGGEALHACATHHPDLVLLDIAMPGIDAFFVRNELPISVTVLRSRITGKRSDER